MPFRQFPCISTVGLDPLALLAWHQHRRDHLTADGTRQREQGRRLRENVTNDEGEAGGVETAGNTKERIREGDATRESVIGSGTRSQRQDHAGLFHSPRHIHPAALRSCDTPPSYESQVV